MQRVHIAGDGIYRPAYTLLLLGLLLVTTTLGCSKDEVQQALADAKSKTQDLADSAKMKTQGMAESAKSKTQQISEATARAVEGVLPAGGSLRIDGNTSMVEASRASVSLFTIGDGRPNSIQISTYDLAADASTFPAYFFQAASLVGDAASLSGETLFCEMFFQATPSAPVCMTEPGKPVEVRFTRFDPQEGTLHAILGPAELVSSDGGTMSLQGGDLIAVVEEAQ